MLICLVKCFLWAQDGLGVCGLQICRWAQGVFMLELAHCKALQVSFPRFLLGPFFRADFKL